MSYTYSSSAELNKVTDVTSTNFDYVTGASYSPLGTLQQLNLANQVASTLGWNNLARLTSILTQKSGSAALLNLGYSYYANSQIQQVTNNLDGLKTEKYTYDELRRLLTAQRGPDANIQRKYSYDYDRFGNRWGQTLVAGSGFGGTNSFDYTNNRVTSPNFSFDNSGNITANGPDTSFTFNAENFMTAAGASATYSVDTKGRRTKKTVSGTTTNYFYSGSVVISEKQGSAWTDYIFFGNQRMAQQTGSTLTAAKFLHQDHLGSTRVCSDGSGNSAGTCDYEPFGEFQLGSACSSLPTNYRFAGMYYDSESGLYYTWFRQYDANQGRWMGVDPLPGSPSDPQSLNRYDYARNDPANLVDPSGLDPGCGEGCHALYLKLGDNRRGPYLGCSCPGHVIQDVPGICTIVMKNGVVISNSCSGGEERPRPDRDRDKAKPQPANNDKKMTPQQCQAAQTLLNREAQYGTTRAAWQSAIGFGDSTVEPFNSSVPGNAYVNTAAGTVKVDWFTDLRLTTLIPGPQVPAYIVAKVVWTGERLVTGAPVTNYLPFQDPVESRTMTFALIGFGFRDLFTPEFMKENCGQ